MVGTKARRGGRHGKRWRKRRRPRFLPAARRERGIMEAQEKEFLGGAVRGQIHREIKEDEDKSTSSNVMDTKAGCCKAEE